MTINPIQPRLGDDDWQNWAHQATPLFRWAGGKRRFIMSNSNKFPAFSGTYHEPFAGSLAVYFWLAARSETPFTARISDINLKLIRTYQQIKSEPSIVWEDLLELIEAFRKSPDQSAFYYRIRDTYNLNQPAGDAARFLFLMATGWNGVYRTNSQGKFNVPFGNAEKLPKFPSESDIFTASLVLQHADIRACSWETSLTATNTGDFVFLDPPYLVGDHRDSNIYEKDKSFSFSDHEKLANELVNLSNRGVDFILTNSCSNQLIAMYKDLSLTVEVVSSRRSINRNTEERGEEAELIISPCRRRDNKRNMEDDFDLTIRLMGKGKEKNDK